MTTANKITILRILLVPFFIVQVLYYVSNGDEIHRLLAMASFGIAAVCDGVDGYIARRYNQFSELGAILDPLADKLLLVAGIVLFSMKNEPYFDRIPVWLTTAIISRDVLLLIGLILIQTNCAKAVVKPRITGKLCTVFQIVLISWILLQWHDMWLPVWIWLVAFFTLVSFIFYALDGIRQLSASPKSSAAPRTDARAETRD